MERASRRYGIWAGNPGGTAENPALCITAVGFGDFGGHGHQCRRPRGHGDGGLYCRQHAEQAARNATSEKAYTDRKKADAEITREGAELTKRVGAGQVRYDSSGPSRLWGYRRELILSFEVVERLLNNKETSP